MLSVAFPAQIYTVALVFTRVGSIVMLIPGVGEAFVPPRIRLGLALLLSMCLAPIVQPALAAVPASLGDVGGQLIGELVIGLMLGALMRLMLSALAVTGEVISIATTLAFAQTSNPLQAQPGAALSSFLTLLGTTLIFATNMHHMFFAAMLKSYTLFAPGKPIHVGDAATLAIHTVGALFALGIQLSAPVVVFSLVLQIATGLVGRVMPQFQIFFASTPLAVLLGLSIFTLSLGGAMMVWLQHYNAFLAPLT